MTDSPKERLETDLKTAMKDRDRRRVDTLRLLLSTLENRRIELGEEVSEADFLALVRKAVKQRAEAAEQYRRGGRDEQAAQEEAESEILQAYLPAPVDEAAVRAEVERFVAAEGLEGPRAMGQVMKAMVAHFEGRVDGKTLSGIVREVLGS